MNKGLLFMNKYLKILPKSNTVLEGLWALAFQIDDLINLQSVKQV